MEAMKRKWIQDKGDDAMRKLRDGKLPITKTDSLNERAKKLKIATDMPTINRTIRRHDLKVAIREESKKKGDK